MAAVTRNQTFTEYDEKSGLKFLMFFNGDSDELCDIEKVIGETTDLIAKQPAVAKELQRQLVGFLNRYYAAMPKPPAEYKVAFEKRLAEPP